MTFASGLTTGHQAGAHRLARYRSEFPIFRDRIYLNTCSLGALGERARNKVVEFVDLWQARGASAWYDVWWDVLSELRGRYVSVIGADLSLRTVPVDAPLSAIRFLTPAVVMCLVVANCNVLLIDLAELAGTLEPAIPGCFGHRNQFGFEPRLLEWHQHARLYDLS